MMSPLKTLDRHLKSLNNAYILVLAVCGVLLVGWLKYLMGYEVGVSLFFLGPVALAAWYGGRWSFFAITFLSCLSWYVAYTVTGHVYSHPAIPLWNTFIRFGFFFIIGALLIALRRNLRELQYLAQTDDLTGLYTRRVFEDRLEHDIALGQRRKSALTLAYVDVDNFKVVNDTHGHAGGDRALKLIARVLRESLRDVDTATRVGGDEFALILPDTDGLGAQQVIRKFTTHLQDAFAAAELNITCSIGVVTFADSATTPGEAVAAADALMYDVKRKGKGAVAFNEHGAAA